MRLINADKLQMEFYGLLFEGKLSQRAMTLINETLESTETVEAIPVEWIENYIESRKWRTIPQASASLQVQFMLNHWKDEQNEYFKKDC